MNFVINSTEDILAKLCLTGFYWLEQHRKMNLGIEYDNHFNFFIKTIFWFIRHSSAPGKSGFDNQQSQK
jgi:hypothetical protein